MQYRKFNKYEKKDVRKHLIENAFKGGGIYVYQNRSKVAEMTLPKATASGVRKIGPDEKFQGDDYYMQMVKSGDLILIEVIQTAQQQEQQMLNEERLILDQPNRVTQEGQVENVVANPNHMIKENENQKKQPEVLINESPTDNSFVIVSD